ncbi:MAG TPA: hypothetical protein VGM90_05815 [Kofleriaceae bacterium]|jgi:hypothetical protein
MKAFIGVLVVAAHVLMLRELVRRVEPADFAVDVYGPLASPNDHLTIRGEVGGPIRDRVAISLDGSPGPGLHRWRWSIDYRGGFSRSAYAAQLVGPYQDPDHLACSGRVVIAQSLLDDGNASEGTLAAEIRKEVTSEMRGLSVWPAGAFTRIEHISVKWARLELHPDDWSMIGKAPHGYVQVSLRIGFDRVSVPMVLALIPNDIAVGSPELTFKIVSRADFSFDNRVFQFLNDKLGGSKLATKLAREQIDGVLLTALSPPPPFALDDKPDGQTLQFTYCDQPTDVADNQWGALPFAVAIGRVNILPPKHGPAPHADIAKDAQIAIDLDLDALNAILFELWRGGYLDKKLAEAGLDQTFNADPTVVSLLSIRISPPRLALPPVLSVSPVGTSSASGTSGSSGALRLLADARVTIADGAEGDPHRTAAVGRIWGGVDFAFVPQSRGPQNRGATSAGAPPISAGAAPAIGASLVQLSALDLACERGTATASHATLVPCYGDLVATMRDRSNEFDGPLTTAFARLLSDVFVGRRIGAEGLPADILISTASPSVAIRGNNAALHLDLRATLTHTK